MTDFDQQRSNMVDSQLRTNDVTDHRILKAMLELPREKFVPVSQKGNAYMDMDISLEADSNGEKRKLLSPMVLGKLVQLADIGSSDVVLLVGCNTGYAAAVIATLADAVVCLDSDEGRLAEAAARLEALGCDNAATVHGSLADGYSKEAPYDVIVINGGVEMIPDMLFDQLKDNGRLVAVQKGDDLVGKAKLYRKVGSSVGESNGVFDAFVDTLVEFRKTASFVF